MTETQQRPIAETDQVPDRTITLTVNGTEHRVRCEDRETLIDVLRSRLGLVGSHAGCLNGDCGCCTVQVDGRIIKSCLVMAAAADGCDVTTIEGLASEGKLTALQQAFWEHDGFQCGFCLPGHLFAAGDLLQRNPDPSDDEIRQSIAGNLCRCTGYQKIIEAIRAAASAAR
jgi:carbon-monoxide dehydrogenase small subunit